MASKRSTEGGLPPPSGGRPTPPHDTTDGIGAYMDGDDLRSAEERAAEESRRMKRLRDLMKRTVSFDNVSAFASLPGAADGTPTSSSSSLMGRLGGGTHGGGGSAAGLAPSPAATVAAVSGSPPLGAFMGVPGRGGGGAAGLVGRSPSAGHAGTTDGFAVGPMGVTAVPRRPSLPALSSEITPPPGVGYDASHAPVRSSGGARGGRSGLATAAAKASATASRGVLRTPGFSTKKLVIVMVGLPARGKTHMARCLERYLNWLGFTARVFNVGEYRRKFLGATQPAAFFDPSNPEGARARWELALECLRDMTNWLEEGGLVGIYDATNSTRDRREVVRTRLEADGVRVLFLESICDDAAIVEKNILETKARSPDYRFVDAEAAVADFKKRIANYCVGNETVLDEEQCSYIKIINVGSKIILNGITGYVQGKIVSYLANAHIMPRAIYLSRHGESEWNVTGQLGGDPNLTPRGRRYAHALNAFIMAETKKYAAAQPRGADEASDDDEDDSRSVEAALPLVWTSQLRRTRQTVAHIPTINMCWRALNEIDAGVCEGLTYASVAETMPDVAAARKADKLRYRYPGGESYVDVLTRLEPVILELERQRGPVLIVAHNAVIRGIYAYLMNKSQSGCPSIDIPLHTVFKLTTRAYGAEEERFPLDVEATYNNRTPDSDNADEAQEGGEAVDGAEALAPAAAPAAPAQDGKVLSTV